MFIKKWKKEIFTVPNLLSLLRLLLVPVYISVYRNASTAQDYLIAGTILGVSCLTDAIDGFIARKFHMSSTLGKLLDPLADKITQIALTICLSLRYPVLLPVIILLLTKEGFQIAGTIILLRRGGTFPSAMYAGKISTTVLFISLITLVLFPNVNPKFVSAIAVLDSMFLVYAFVTYCIMFTGYSNKTHHSQG